MDFDDNNVAIKYPDQGSMSYFYDHHGARIESQLRRDEDDVMVHVRLDFQRSQMRLEFNPSRFTQPGGGLCHLRDLPMALDLACDFVDVQLGVATTARQREQAVVQRVDLARDFAMAGARSLLPLLTPLKRKYARRIALYYDPQTLLPNALVVGNRESHCKLYVRDGRHPEFPGLDWLRFEMQARAEWLLRVRAPAGNGSAAGPVRFAELTEVACVRLLRDRWRWSAFGTPFDSSDGWWSRVQADVGLDRARALAAYLFALQNGVDLGYQRDAVTENQKLLRRHGVPVELRRAAASHLAEVPHRLVLRSETPQRVPRPRAQRAP